MRLVFISAVVAVTASTTLAEPIHDAAARGDAEAVQRLLAEGTPVDQFDTTDPYERKTTALFKATMAGRIEVIELLLNAGADPTLRSSDGPAAPHPLQVAARAGRNDILTMFLDRGADPNAPGNDAAALHGALVSRKPETVQLLLDAGALPRIEQPSIASRLSAEIPIGVRRSSSRTAEPATTSHALTRLGRFQTFGISLVETSRVLRG